MTTTTPHTYTHRFSNGTVAKATVGDSVWRIEWSAKPTPDMLREYFVWRAELLRDYTRRTGKRVLVITV